MSSQDEHNTTPFPKPIEIKLADVLFFALRRNLILFKDLGKQHVHYSFFIYGSTIDCHETLEVDHKHIQLLKIEFDWQVLLQRVMQEVRANWRSIFQVVKVSDPEWEDLEVEFIPVQVLVELFSPVVKGARWNVDLGFLKKLDDSLEYARLGELVEESERFIELIYATLVAWDMNSRGAKMKYFDQFKSSILGNKERFIQLVSVRLEALSGATVGEVKMRLGQIYDNMHVMESSGKLVSNSKVMHFILPDLVMPMDRQNTLNFFFGNTNESESYFLRIFGHSYEIAKKIDLHQFLDEEWNLSIPKVIDNAIISRMSPKYNR